MLWEGVSLPIERPKLWKYGMRNEEDISFSI